MRLRLIFIVGMIVGYILGARAGRSRYDKIKATAADVWDDPRVQQAVSETEKFVEKNAPILADKIGDSARIAADKLAGAAKIAGTSITEGAKVVVDAAAKFTDLAKETEAGAGDTAAEASARATSALTDAASQVDAAISEHKNVASDEAAPNERPTRTPDETIDSEYRA